jgi:hypothetical protein
VFCGCDASHSARLSRWQKVKVEIITELLRNNLDCFLVLFPEPLRKFEWRFHEVLMDAFHGVVQIPQNETSELERIRLPFDCHCLAIDTQRCALDNIRESLW